MQTDLSIYNSLRPSFIEGVHAVKFNALSAVISRYRDYARSSEQIKAYSGDSLLMRDIASLLDEAPRPITGEYQDFTPFLLLLMLSEEFHAVHYVERLVRGISATVVSMNCGRSAPFCSSVPTRITTRCGCGLRITCVKPVRHWVCPLNVTLLSC